MPDQHPNAINPHVTAAILESTRHVMTERIGDYVAKRLTASAEPNFAESIGRSIAVRFETHVLTEKLPPHTVEVRAKYQHPEAVGERVEFTTRRYARPIDHFTDKYRDTWWGRLLLLRRRTVRRQDQTFPFRVTVPVECDHRVTVNVRAQWTYPRAHGVGVDMSELGHPVLRADTYESTYAPW